MCFSITRIVPVELHSERQGRSQVRPGEGIAAVVQTRRGRRGRSPSRRSNDTGEGDRATSRLTAWGTGDKRCGVCQRRQTCTETETRATHARNGHNAWFLSEELSVGVGNRRVEKSRYTRDVDTCFGFSGISDELGTSIDAPFSGCLVYVTISWSLRFENATS